MAALTGRCRSATPSRRDPRLIAARADPVLFEMS